MRDYVVHEVRNDPSSEHMLNKFRFKNNPEAITLMQLFDRTSIVV
jgi:hypothetical protein